MSHKRDVMLMSARKIMEVVIISALIHLVDISAAARKDTSYQGTPPVLVSKMILPMYI